MDTIKLWTSAALLATTRDASSSSSSWAASIPWITFISSSATEFHQSRVTSYTGTLCEHIYSWDKSTVDRTHFSIFVSIVSCQGSSSPCGAAILLDSQPQYTRATIPDSWSKSKFDSQPSNETGPGSIWLNQCFDERDSIAIKRFIRSNEWP